MTEKRNVSYYHRVTEGTEVFNINPFTSVNSTPLREKCRFWYI